MSDEEKQPNNNSQQTQEAGVLSQEDISSESAVPEVELSIENDLDVQPNFGEQNPEVSETKAAADIGESWETVAVESATDGSSSEGDGAAWENLKRENEALKAQLEELNQQSDSFKTQSMRIAADFDNFRKRTEKEKEELEQRVKRVTLTELLPVVDNFERARSHIKPQNEGEMTIHKSYQGVYKQLVDCLKRIGVSPMRPEGQEFDPNLHEAVMREPSAQYSEGVVIEQLMRGYMLNDRVLRHAMVKVASAPEHPIEDSEEDSESSSG
jgi:molecular chaperone GrpE